MSSRVGVVLTGGAGGHEAGTARRVGWEGGGRREEACLVCLHTAA